MNSNDTRKNPNDPPAAATPNPSPLGTQVTQMPGQKPDEHKGAVEGDHPSDEEPGNKNAVGALDKDGLPKNKKAIAEDSIGARADETQG